MTAIMSEDRELTLAEVAARLRVSVDTARGILQKGEIAARKQGRQWRVSEQDIERYIREARQRRQQ